MVCIEARWSTWYCRSWNICLVTYPNFIIVLVGVVIRSYKRNLKWDASSIKKPLGILPSFHKQAVERANTINALLCFRNGWSFHYKQLYLRNFLGWAATLSICCSCMQLNLNWCMNKVDSANMIGYNSFLVSNLISFTEVYMIVLWLFFQIWKQGIKLCTTCACKMEIRAIK